MLTVLGAIDLLPRRTNAPKKRSLTTTFLGLRSLDPRLLNAPRIPRPWTGPGTTIKTRGVIEKAVVIVALTAQDFQAPPQPLKSIQPIPWLGMTETATGYQSGRTRTWLKSLIIIVTRSSILLTSAPNPTSQKTSISLGNLNVGD